MFKDIYLQNAESLAEGGLNIDSSKAMNMTSSAFSAMARQRHHELFGDRSPTIQEAEDLHWSEFCKSSKLYAMNNSLSLFGDDCELWNLDRFTSRESLIHYEQSHHQHNVCIFMYFSTYFTRYINYSFFSMS